MNPWKPTTRDFWLIILVLLSATPVVAEESPVVASRLAWAGYELTPGKDADFWVTITWIVPHATQGSRTCGFKGVWRQEEEHADGSISMLVPEGVLAEGGCGDGPGGGANSSVFIAANDSGPWADLSLLWRRGNYSGKLKHDFHLSWSQLRNVYRTKAAKVYVEVLWPKR